MNHRKYKSPIDPTQVKKDIQLYSMLAQGKSDPKDTLKPQSNKRYQDDA